ncbi:Ig-like domain-containing protein [Bacillus sp. FJAT-28004]|uniref:Ig-like domain-containing protein n=1 Tax=Bacillus sp. FJAT-28004 TaxID=1679165 RepID=UPI0007C78633|nr:Ig-like domain-containing protein [Bacillus sp. FJAT-28004]
MPQHSGFTPQTGDRLVLDAGAFYKNYDLNTNTGTLLGATRGGGEFKAVPSMRAIEVDGVKGRAKGLNAIDSWDVTIMANMLEITPQMLASALATGSVDSATNNMYDIITASNTISIANYLDNITWVGRLSGSNNPVIIQIFNALNTEGVTLKTEDKGESVLPVTFAAHYDAFDLDMVPFKIYYPKLSGDTTPPTVTVVPADAATAIAVSASVVWTFNEAINPTLVNPSNFLLIKADGTNVPGALTINAAKTVVTLKPTTNMTAASDHIAIASSNIKDLNGNSLVQKTSKFRTA